MADVEKYALEIKQLVKDANELSNRLNSSCGSSLEWATEEIIDSYLSLYDRFCPFKIGDRVQLTKYYTKKDTGWEHCKHFLNRGSTGKVVNRGYKEGLFIFDIVFDNESWIDNDGVENKTKDKHTFAFNENWLEQEIKKSRRMLK